MDIRAGSAGPNLSRMNTADAANSNMQRMSIPIPMSINPSWSNAMRMNPSFVVTTSQRPAFPMTQTSTMAGQQTEPQIVFVEESRDNGRESVLAPAAGSNVETRPRINTSD